MSRPTVARALLILLTAGMLPACGGGADEFIPPRVINYPTVGRVGHWRFDDGAGTTALDSSGNNHHGTLSGAGAWTGGKWSGALDFDGADDYVRVTSTTALNPTGAISFSVWINADIWESSNRILEKGVDANYQYVFECSATNQLRFGLRGIGDVFVAAPSLGTWHHLAATYDGALMIFYIDGGVAGQTAATGAIFVSTEDLFIGTKWATSPVVDYLDARLDDLLIYNRALTPAEILELGLP